VQVIADDFEPQLGAASLELHYDAAQLSVESCVAAPITAMNAGVCYAAPGAGSARLNYAAVNGIAPEAVLAELTFASVGGYDMAQLAQDLDLQINSAFDHEGGSFTWPELPTLDFSTFLPLVVRGAP
jgi:hypothetical protein